MNFKKFINDNLWEAEHHEDVVPAPVQKNSPANFRPTASAQPSTWLNSDGPAAAVSTMAPPSQFTADAPTGSPSVLEGARKHFKDSLKDLHTKLNVPDYYVFISAKNQMSNYVPVESDRYKMALISLGNVGLTKETVLQTAQQYSQAIDDELQGFASSYDPQFKQQVDDKKAAIEQKAQQMRDLNAKIQQLNEEIKQMNDDVLQNESSLSTAKQSFERAGAEAKAEIATEIQKINLYIQ